MQILKHDTKNQFGHFCDFTKMQSDHRYIHTRKTSEVLAGRMVVLAKEGGKYAKDEALILYIARPKLRLIIIFMYEYWGAS